MRAELDNAEQAEVETGNQLFQGNGLAVH